MMIYLTGFAISLLLLWAAEKTPEHSATYNAFIVTAILLPVVIAGVRGETVGTDVTVYVKQLTDAAIQSDTFGEYYQTGWVNKDFYGGYAYTNDYEPGFILLVYITAKVFRHLSAVLFAIQLFITLFVYRGLAYYRDRLPVWLGMAVFYFMNYNTSLNMMRQWMAMAVLFCGIYYINKKPVLYGVFIVFAACFHISGIVCGTIIFLVAWYTKRVQGHGTQLSERLFPVWSNGWLYVLKNTMRLVLMVGCVLLVIFCMPIIVRLMWVLGLQRYVAYVNGIISFMPIQIIMRLPAYVLIGLGYHKFQDRSYLSYFLLAMVVLDTLFSQLSGISTYSSRITAYFNMFYMLSLPMVCVEKDSRDYRVGMVTMLFAYLLFYWIFFYVFEGYGQTLPYVTFWNV